MEEKKDKIMLAQDNQLTQSRYNFSVIEKRCLYQIIREVRNRYIETGNKPTKFENMSLELKPNQLAQLGDEAKDVYKALKRLVDKKIEIDTEKEWIYTGWVMSAHHDKEKNIYEIDISKHILPYLVELAPGFTQYDLMVAITLKSTYSQRFYELCCQYKNYNKYFFLTVERLREILMLENKYTQINDFKRKVLEVAQKELKELYDKGQCDLWFDYDVKDTDKRKILSYHFHIHTKEDEQNKVDYQSVTNCLQRISSILSTFFPRDKKYIKRVIQEVQLRPDIAMELVYKLDKKVMDYDKKEIPPIIRYVLNSDYGIK